MFKEKGHLTLSRICALSNIQRRLFHNRWDAFLGGIRKFLWIWILFVQCSHDIFITRECYSDKLGEGYVANGNDTKCFFFILLSCVCHCRVFSLRSKIVAKYWKKNSHSLHKSMLLYYFLTVLSAHTFEFTIEKYYYILSLVAVNDANLICVTMVKMIHKKTKKRFWHEFFPKESLKVALM